MNRIETIAQAQKRLMCRALNKYGSIEKSFPFLSPSGSPSIKGLYNLREKLKIKKNTQGVFE